MRSLAGIAFLVLVACGSTASTPATPAAPAAAAQGSADLAPFPYTAEQLRAAFPAGRVLRYEATENGQTMTMETTFVEVTAEAATMETTLRDAGGTPLGEPQRATTAWAELVKHASYPAATTSIDDVEIETPTGKHPAKKYVVRKPDDKGRPSVTIAYFDAARPGPPVRMLVEVDGVITQQLVLVGDK